MNWRTWKMGDKVVWKMQTRKRPMEGEVTEICEDHAIVTVGKAMFWFDDETDVVFVEGENGAAE